MSVLAGTERLAIARLCVCVSLLACPRCNDRLDPSVHLLCALGDKHSVTLQRAFGEVGEVGIAAQFSELLADVTRKRRFLIGVPPLSWTEEEWAETGVLGG